VGTLSSLAVTGNITSGNITGVTLIGTVTMSASGNISGGNILGGANVNATTHTGTTVSVTGNITGGNILGGANVNATTHTGATVSVTGNITGGNVVTAGLVSLSSITKTGSNAVGNIGQSNNYFNTVFAQATSALYADLAENYTADQNYEPGTVVCFDGSAEITQCNTDSCVKVAGVVSTNPAYQMNAGLQGEHVVSVALVGRVPCRVQGPVTRGAMMVSAGNGLARASLKPEIGTVIGKALENFDGDIGVIEVVVGRL
jgi:hypothetical protein